MASPAAKPRTSRRQTLPLNDLDLTSGGFRLDLRTGILLLALAGSWWDFRSQSEKRSEIEGVRAEYTKETLGELKRLQAVQQYDIGAIKLALAAQGINIKKSEP